MADTRTMSELLQAPTEGYGDAIVVPPILAENFELKVRLLLLVTSSQFHGFERDDPHSHIRWFNKITSTLKYKNVLHDAWIWLEKEPPRSIHTWEDLVSKFVNYFFPPSKTTNLKNDIMNFQQRFDETFSEAWDRFKDLLRNCPHHGFSELHQINTFYNALTQSDQDSLNAAAGGNLLNLSTTTSSPSPSLDVTVLTEIVKELVLMNKATQQATIKAIEETCVTYGGPHPYYECLAADGNTFDACAAVGTYNQGAKEHDDNFLQMQNPSGSGSLPSNTVANPRGDVKAITTQSGVAYEGPSIPPTSFSLPKKVEREPEVTKDKVQPTNLGSTAHFQPPVVQVPISEPDVAPKPNPKPSIPYPSRLNDQKLREMLIIKLIQFASAFKSLLSNKEKLFELANTPLNENCSSVLLKKLPEKLGDPGKFLIPCDFSELVECLALADLGVSINLMPLSVWKKLSLPKLTPTRMTLELANDRLSIGLVLVHNDVDPRVPLILGRPFLRTARALIDVYGEELTLRFNDEAITFIVGHTSRYSYRHDYESVNQINVIDVACEEYAQEVLGFLDSSTSGNPLLRILSLLLLPPRSLLLKEEISFGIIKLLDAGLIYPISDSPWASLVHCVPKKGGMTVITNEDNELIPTRLVIGWCVCIDYRKLNDATRKDHFPLPFMDQMLECLVGNEYYCFLDGFSRYFQISIDPQDQEKTTFTCPYGTFAHRRMPFGLCNAPGTSHRLHDGPFSQDNDRGNNGEGIVLGHKISKFGIEVDRAKVDVIAKLPHPTSVKGVRKKDTPFIFSKECIEAFETFKTILTEASILVSLDWDLPFEIICDASDYAVGAVLGQRKTKHFQPIHYASKTMTDAQAHYTTTKKELLAVVYAFEKFRPYLVLSKTIVYTDHSAIKYLLAKQDAKSRLLRWILLLQEFNVIIRDKKKGAENLAADHLSRLEIPHQGDLENTEINETFPLETFGMISFHGDSRTPWFADIENYHAGNFIVKGMSSQQKKKFFKDSLISSRLTTMDPPGDIMERTTPLRKSLIPGPFPSSRGNKYILVAVEYFSKWVEAKVLPTNDARVVIKFLKSLFARFGTPRAIISDRGTHFCNDQFAKVMLKYGVTHRLSTTYHPQTSGQVEVSNRGLRRILERTVGENCASRSDKLDDALWAFRTAFKAPIGCTPYKLVYEKACHLPIELEHRAYWALKHCNFDLKSAGDHRKVQMNELNELRDQAYKEKTKEIHDSKIKNRVFNVGDRVLLFNSRLKIFSGKLKTRWTGPFTVTQFFPYGTIELSQNDRPNFKDCPDFEVSRARSFVHRHSIFNP
ncbi:reverse transcriptase domain-containing protein [Tanacetum coccineum]